MEEKQTNDLSDNDEDSGNDEPPYTTSVNRNDVGAGANAGENSRRSSNADATDAIPVDAGDDDGDANGETDEHKKAFSGDRPNPMPPRNLRHYLNMLAEKQDQIDDIQLGAQTARIDGEPVTMCNMPVEVLLTIFAFLDDFSLCNVGDVCKRWSKILETHTPQAMWQKYTKERWPLFHEITHVPNWLRVCSRVNCDIHR